MKQILTLYLSIILTGSLFGQAAAGWNKKGIDALKKKDYDKAISSFENTLKASPKDAYANYNIACAYALKIKEDNCLILEYEEKILNHLKKATAGDKSYQAKMQKDKDFDTVKSKVQFHKIAGLSPKDILTKVIWYGPSPGAFGPMDQFVFKADGSFIYSKKLLEDDANPGKLTDSIGTYEWKENNLILQFKNSKEFPKKLKVKYKNNELEVEGIDHKFTDNDDPCSA